MQLTAVFDFGPDIDALADRDRVIGADGAIDTNHLLQKPDPWSEAALELAAKFRSRAASSVVAAGVSALTLAGPETDAICKTLLALQFDRVLRLDRPAERRFQPIFAASVLARLLRRAGAPDVVLIGRERGPDNDGTTPYALAEFLNFPSVSDVADARPLDEKRIRVLSRDSSAETERVVRTPIVLVVGDFAPAALRRPTLQDRMRYGRRPVEVVETASLSDRLAEGTDPQPSLLSAAPRGRGGRIVEGGDAMAVARRLWHEELQDRIKQCKSL